MQCSKIASGIVRCSSPRGLQIAAGGPADPRRLSRAQPRDGAQPDHRRGARRSRAVHRPRHPGVGRLDRDPRPVAPAVPRCAGRRHDVRQALHAPRDRSVPRPARAASACCSRERPGRSPCPRRRHGRQLDELAPQLADHVQEAPVARVRVLPPEWPRDHSGSAPPRAPALPDPRDRSGCSGRRRPAPARTAARPPAVLLRTRRRRRRPPGRERRADPVRVAVASRSISIGSRFRPRPRSPSGSTSRGSRAAASAGPWRPSACSNRGRPCRGAAPCASRRSS